MIPAHQGPRESLMRKPLDEVEHQWLRVAIEHLESVQRSVQQRVGDSIERTTICRALEKLHGLTRKR